MLSEQKSGHIQYVDFLPMRLLITVHSLSLKECVKARPSLQGKQRYLLFLERHLSFLKVTIKQLNSLIQYIRGPIISKNCFDDRITQIQFIFTV